MVRQRLIVYQESFPIYRKRFFEHLSEQYSRRFTLKIFSTIGIDADNSGRDYRWLEVGGRKIHFWKFNFWTGDVFKDFFTNAKFVYPAFSNNITIFFLAFISIFYRRRVFYWGHLRSSSGDFFSNLRVLFFLFSGRYIFYTETEMSRFLSHPFGKHFRSRVGFIGNSVDTLTIEKFRQTYDPGVRRGNVFFIGRNTVKSKFSLILKIAAEPCFLQIKFHVVGVSLQDLDPELSVPPNVYLYGALIDEYQIARIANLCRIAFYPGAVGLSLVHAAAYGLPTVLLGDPSKHMPEFELVLKADCGIVVPSEQDYQQTLIRFALGESYEASLIELSERCRSEVQSNYSPRAMSNKLIKILGDEVLNCEV